MLLSWLRGDDHDLNGYISNSSNNWMLIIRHLLQIPITGKKSRIAEGYRIVPFRGKVDQPRG